MGYGVSSLVSLRKDARMLVLSRKLSESIIIGDNVRITVVGISGNQVRLGFEAPKEVQIYREEIRDQGPRRERDS